MTRERELLQKALELLEIVESVPESWITDFDNTIGVIHEYLAAQSGTDAQPAPVPPGWMPIESAPKDWGVTTFDVWRRNTRVADCWWGTPTYGAKIGGVVHQTGYDSDGPVYDYVDGATHWMPLPPPPAIAASPEVPHG